MPSRRWPLLLVPLFLTGCKDRALEERAEQIREYSDKEDRVNSAEAIHQVERQFWTLRDHAWYGKLPDGSIIRLDAPHATAAPLPARAMYSGWHIQLTISSDTWSTYPASPQDHPFQAVYAITRHGPTNWQIDVTNGSETTPLKREDVPTIEETGSD